MDPRRKRKIRLVLALASALLLSGALIYTSFSTSSQAITPSRLRAHAKAGRTYQLSGKVERGSIVVKGEELRFRVRDRDGTVSVPVAYRGVVPDPFRDEREIIIRVRKQGSRFIGERDSLITKCPSKFAAEQRS